MPVPLRVATRLLSGRAKGRPFLCLSYISFSYKRPRQGSKQLLSWSGDAFGPAGNVSWAWRKLTGRSLLLQIEDLKSDVHLLRIVWSNGFADYVGDFAAEMRSGAPSPRERPRRSCATTRVKAASGISASVADRAKQVPCPVSSSTI